MLNKKFMMLALILLMLVTVSGVSASEDFSNDAVDLENQDINSISEIDNYVLNANPKTFTDLNELINGNNDSDIYLDCNYTYAGNDSSFGGGIVISRAVTIHGNGFTIDGNKNARIFDVSNSDVVFRDIVFLNAYGGDGSAINGVCAAVNCTFINNSNRGHSGGPDWPNVGYGGAMYGGSAVNCTFIGNSVKAGDRSYGGAMYGGSAVNCSFINNFAYSEYEDSEAYGGAMYGGSAVNCTFTGNYVDSKYHDWKSTNDCGGAMYGGSAVNCTFTKNIAHGGEFSYGGAMYDGFAVNCIFIKNSAMAESSSYGGAMCGGSAVNCSFIDNSIGYEYGDGGAICGVFAVNCSFVNNSAEYGGAMCGDSAENCLFVNNSAEYGGAMCGGSAVNCSFINNFAYSEYEDSEAYGGAIYCGFAENCLFVNNSAAGNGGAIYLDDVSANFVNCSFLDNTAEGNGGAIYSTSKYITVVNCSFVNNCAVYNGGAVSGVSAENCLFVNNSALCGGAVYDVFIDDCLFEYNVAENGGAMSKGKARNSTFNYNNATFYGGAIYDAVVFKDCKFNDNHALYGNDAYNVSWAGIKSFYDLDYLINSNINKDIYLQSDYAFNLTSDSDFKEGIVINRDVTIHGDGYTINADKNARIFKISNSYVTLENIVFVNGNATEGGAIYGSSTSINCTFKNNTGVYGGATYNVNNLNCTFINNDASSNGGAMYKGSAVDCSFVNNSADGNGGAVYDVFIDDCLFEYNVAENGGAMSKGKAKNSTFNYNNATFYGGAIYDAVVFTDCKFKDNHALYGNDTYNVTWTDKSFSELNDLINSNNNTDIYLECNYKFDSTINSDFKYGIVINRAVTIHGNGYTINADNNARIFRVSNSEVVLENIVFVNGKADNGGAILGSCTSINCTFINNSASGNGGATYQVTALNCTFINNDVSSNGGAMYQGSAVNCSFVNNSAKCDGAAMYQGSAVNCSFVNNSAKNGGAMYQGSAVNCSFIDNSAEFNGGSMYFTSKSDVVNCSFINNFAKNDGGAVYSAAKYIMAMNCSFVNNSAGRYGGATYWVKFNNCIFTGNSARNSGGAVYEGPSVNCTFIGNSAGQWGGAMFKGSSIDCTFINNSAKDKGGAKSSGSDTNCIFINNTAKSGGASSSEGTSTNSTFINNSASEFGGARVFGSAVNCTFVNNSAKNGGATYQLTANDCSFTNNTATEYGGAMYEGTAIKCIFKQNGAGIDGNDTYKTILPKYVLSVSNFTSTYNSGDKLIINLTFDGIQVNDANVTIMVYENNVLVGTYYCLSGDGWVVDLDMGNYLASVSVDSHYLVDQVNATLEINKVNARIVAEDVFADNNECNLVATLIDDSTGNAIGGADVVFKLNDDEYTVKTNDDGMAKVHVSDLAPGTYTATVSYDGDDYYNSTSETFSVVNKITTSISLYYDSESDELVASLINTQTGNAINNANVVFNVGGKKTSVKTNQGQARFVIGGDSATFDAEVSYGGNSKYFKSNASIKIVEGKVPTVISNVYDKENGEVVATLTNVETGKAISGATVVFNVNGVKTSAKTNKTGQVKYSVENLTSNEYSFGSSYGGNSKYAGSTATINIAIIKITTGISLYVDYTNKELVASLIDMETDEGISDVDVIFKINEQNYTVKTNADGEARLSISGFAPDDYDAVVSYDGDTSYAPCSETLSFTVYKTTTSITLYYDKTTNELVASLINTETGAAIKGATVVFNVEGVKNAVKTDKQGKARLLVSGVDLDNFHAAISYGGNSKYLKSTASIDIVAGKIPTKVSNAYNEETQEAVATLTNNQTGQAIKGATVVFNINGVKTALKTDKFGQVKISVANLDLGVNSISSSYGGNSKYSKTTANVNIVKV